MHRAPRPIGIAAVTALASGLCLSASAQPATQAEARANQPAKPAAAAQPATGDILVFYSAGLDNALWHPKDAGFRAAFDMIPDRLIELIESQTPFRSPDQPEPEEVVSTAWALLTAPTTMRIAMVEPEQDGAPPLAVRIAARPENARAVERSLTSMLRDAGVESRMAGGARQFDTPAGPVALRNDDGQMTLSYGNLPERNIDWGLPAGTTPLFGMHLNFRNAQPLIQMAVAQSPDPDQIEQMLAQSGILGPNALVIDMAAGHNDRGGVLTGTVHGARANIQALGIPENTTLDRDFLSLIPQDATYVSAGVFSMAQLDQIVEVPEVQDALAQFEDQFGVDLMGDLVDQIGNRFAVYQSDATGGGGILSTVMVMELKDAGRFARAHERLVEHANAFIAQAMEGENVPGGVEIRENSAGGHDYYTLTFPGLPIPAEVSWTIHDNRLMAALSPRSLLEAMSQSAGRDRSFANAPAFAAAAGRNADGILSINYNDTPRFAAQGYGIMSLLAAGLSNAVRTQDGAEPAIVMPAYNEFMQGIQPSMTIARWDGDNIRIHGTFDGSLLANVAGTPSTLIAPVAAAVAAGAVLPAVEKARESAQQAQAASNLRQVATAMHMYANDNRDRIPEDIDDLAEYLDHMMLSSPFGPCYDGSPDFAIRSDLGGSRMGRVEFPSTTLAAIDRAMVINSQEKVAVAFFDGHVEVVYSWEFSDMLAQEQNRGAFEAFDLPDWMNPGF
ncbi:MAG: hypothetical protein R3B68_07560 [Phycisphaerales bacterium]